MNDGGAQRQAIVWDCWSLGSARSDTLEVHDALSAIQFPGNHKLHRFQKAKQVLALEGFLLWFSAISPAFQERCLLCYVLRFNNKPRWAVEMLGSSWGSSEAF